VRDRGPEVETLGCVTNDLIHTGSVAPSRFLWLLQATVLESMLMLMVVMGELFKRCYGLTLHVAE
jgi:hypothetical protein